MFDWAEGRVLPKYGLAWCLEWHGELQTKTAPTTKRAKRAMQESAQPTHFLIIGVSGTVTGHRRNWMKSSTAVPNVRAPCWPRRTSDQTDWAPFRFSNREQIRLAFQKLLGITPSDAR